MLDPEVIEAAYDDAVTSDDYVHETPVTMSMLGGCRRQAAYALDSGWPDLPGQSGAAAYMGGAIHNRLLPDLAERLGGQAEQRVELTIGGLTIVGHSDLVLWEGEVLDLKTVSEFYYPVVRRQPPFHHKYQATGYALATYSIGAALLYVNRSSPDNRFAVSWDVGRYEGKVRRWVEEIQHRPEEVPRDERGPGLSIICDSCPFAGRCWGPDWGPGTRPAQAAVVDELGVEMALEEYDRVRELEKDVKAEKAFWRQALDGQAGADYGPWTLGWTGRSSEEWADDGAAAIRRLEEMGYEVPQKRVTKTQSISVTRRKPPPE